jgi:hypothetical protein
MANYFKMENEYVIDCDDEPISDLEKLKLKKNRKNQSDWNGVIWELSRFAKEGKLDCLKYCLENGVKLDNEELIYNALIGGHIECFNYLCENNCPYNETICCSVTAENNHILC